MCLLWQDEISVVARQDLCCGKTGFLLCQDVRESTKGRGVKRGAPLWRRREAPPPLCLGTREILSCHNRDLVLPQHTSCLATTEILSCHNRDWVFPAQNSSGSEQILLAQKQAQLVKKTQNVQKLSLDAKIKSIWGMTTLFCMF